MLFVFEVASNVLAFLSDGRVAIGAFVCEAVDVIEVGFCGAVSRW